MPCRPASRLRSPFLTWTWQREWVASFAQGRRLELRRVTDGTGQLVALLPLVETAPDRLMLTGGADVSDYLDLLALRDREEEAWTALLGARAAEPLGVGAARRARGLAHGDALPRRWRRPRVSP